MPHRAALNHPFAGTIKSGLMVTFLIGNGAGKRMCRLRLRALARPADSAPSAGSKAPERNSTFSALNKKGPPFGGPFCWEWSG